MGMILKVHGAILVAFGAPQAGRRADSSTKLRLTAADVLRDLRRRGNTMLNDGDFLRSWCARLNATAAGGSRGETTGSWRLITVRPGSSVVSYEQAALLGPGSELQEEAGIEGPLVPGPLLGGDRRRRGDAVEVDAILVRPQREVGCASHGRNVSPLPSSTPNPTVRIGACGTVRHQTCCFGARARTHASASSAAANTMNNGAGLPTARSDNRRDAAASPQPALMWAETCRSKVESLAALCISSPPTVYQAA